MSAPKHSPAPFRRVSRPPSGEDRGGHLILDAFGDSIAALALATGDHPAEEQLANANLFVAAPALLAAAKLGREAVARDLAATIEGHCLLHPVSLDPDLSTLDEVARPIVQGLRATLVVIDEALAFAEDPS